MQLKTRRLVIRYVAEDDWKSLLELWDDFSRSEFAQYDAPHSETEAEAKEKAVKWEKESPKGEHIFFAVCLEHALIGCVDFHKNGTGYELGYCFRSGFHGKGYAKESIAALIERLSGGKKMRFTARTALANIPSVRLLESLGFTKTGEESVSFCEDGGGTGFAGGIFTFEAS